MSMRIPAGEMRHVVRIVQHKVETSSTAYDTYGMVSASSTAWKRIAQVRAKIESLAGYKDTLAGEQHPTANYKVTIDYLSNLDTTGATRRAVEFGSHLLFIRSIVNPDQENRQMELLCGESV